MIVKNPDGFYVDTETGLVVGKVWYHPDSLKVTVWMRRKRLGSYARVEKGRGRYRSRKRWESREIARRVLRMILDGKDYQQMLDELNGEVKYVTLRKIVERIFRPHNDFYAMLHRELMRNVVENKDVYEKMMKVRTYRYYLIKLGLVK